jgi:hypothetical protein
VDRADADAAPLQSAEDEGEEPSLVTDVSHDVKGARFLASPRINDVSSILWAS